MPATQGQRRPARQSGKATTQRMAGAVSSCRCHDMYRFQYSHDPMYTMRAGCGSQPCSRCATRTRAPRPSTRSCSACARWESPTRCWTWCPRCSGTAGRPAAWGTCTRTAPLPPASPRAPKPTSGYGPVGGCDMVILQAWIEMSRKHLWSDRSFATCFATRAKSNLRASSCVSSFLCMM